MFRRLAIPALALLALPAVASAAPTSAASPAPLAPASHATKLTPHKHHHHGKTHVAPKLGDWTR